MPAEGNKVRFDNQTGILNYKQTSNLGYGWDRV